MVVTIVHAWPAAALLVAAGAAFDAVFGVFVAAVVVLAVVTLRWAIRRDRVGRAEWMRRQQESGALPTSPPPHTNGRVPGRHGQRGGGPKRPR